MWLIVFKTWTTLSTLFFSTSSLWEIWSTAPASLLNPWMCCRVLPATHSLCPLEQLHRRRTIRLVEEEPAMFSVSHECDSRGRKYYFWLVLCNVYEAFITACFLFCFLKQRGLMESSFLKRSEAGGSVPAITISVPKPSFAPSQASATADKTSTLNHVTGHYHCSATTLKILSYVKMNLKLRFAVLLSCLLNLKSCSFSSSFLKFKQDRIPQWPSHRLQTEAQGKKRS